MDNFDWSILIPIFAIIGMGVTLLLWLWDIDRTNKKLDEKYKRKRQARMEYNEIRDTYFR